MHRAAPTCDMEPVRDAPLSGVAACLATLLLAVAPLVLVRETAAVTAYYAAGTLTPWATALLALVAVIAFAAGRAGRTDPATAAGAGLALGLFAAVVAVLWALTVPASVAQQFGTASSALAAFLSWHRFLLALAAVAIPGSAAWWARALGLL